MEKGVILELSKVLDSLTKSNLNFNAKRDVLDFKSNKVEILKKSLDKHYENLLKVEREFKKVRYEDVLNTFNFIKLAYQKKDFNEMKTHLVNLQLLLPANDETHFVVDLKLPADIRPELTADIQEMRMCYDASCYRSAVVLCGRILEIALHRKYYEATGNDILETNPSIGLGKLIAKLREHNVKFPPGITEQIHLINKVRISSVHKKKQVFVPSKPQANAIILYSLDVLRQLF